MSEKNKTINKIMELLFKQQIKDKREDFKTRDLESYLKPLLKELSEGLK